MKAYTASDKDIESKKLPEMTVEELQGIVTQWYANQVYGCKPSNKAQAQDQEERAYRLIAELNEKALKYKSIEEAIAYEIIEPIDFEMLEQYEHKRG